jgi:hypothetical protein
MNGELLIPEIDAAQYCLRCGVSVHTTDPSHLCSDIASRLRHEESSARDAMWSEYARELVVHGGEA